MITDDALIEAMIRVMAKYIPFDGPEQDIRSVHRSRALLALAVDAPIVEARFLERLIAKAAQDGIVFVSDGHFGRAKRIQDWLHSQRPVEGGE